jgi:hypothetical protein
MTSFYLAALVLFSADPCIADSQAAIRTTQNGDDTGENASFQYNSDGSTIVTIYGYQVRFTAQQRQSDSMLQIIAYPNEMGVQFRIQNVLLGEAPEQMDTSGPVVTVTGRFFAHINMSNPVEVPMEISVSVQLVDEFTESTQEATMQGYPVMEKQLPNLLSQ